MRYFEAKLRITSSPHELFSTQLTIFRKQEIDRKFLSEINSINLVER